MNNKFANHAVVKRRNGIARINRAIYAHPITTRRMKGSDCAGRGHKGFRVFSIDAALYGVSVNANVVLRKA